MDEHFTPGVGNGDYSRDAASRNVDDGGAERQCSSSDEVLNYKRQRTEATKKDEVLLNGPETGVEHECQVGGIGEDRGAEQESPVGTDGKDREEEVLQLLMEQWRELRERGDFAKSDEVRERLRSMGVNPGARASQRDRDAFEKGYEGCKWARDFRYDEAWGQRARELQFVSTHAYLASSQEWRLAPKLRRYMTIPNQELRRQVAREYGDRILGSSSGAGSMTMRVFCVEKPFIDGFIDAFRNGPSGNNDGGEEEEASAMKNGCHPLHSFVLLAINGGDDPVTAEQQSRISTLKGLGGCFATNLQSSVPCSGAAMTDKADGVPHPSGLFHPLPIGLPGTTAPAVFEEALGRVRAKMPSWAARDPRLLLAPMKNSNNRLRGHYTRVLSRPEFADKVRVVSGRLPLEEFLGLMSQHRATLSPPGRGYDCYRTWQALAVGCIPLVTRDPAFDQRLYEGMGPEYIPRPEDLTPEALADVLSRLSDPSRFAAKLEIQYWRKQWDSILLQQGVKQ